MLSIVATPIGNLEDMTLRGIRILKEADLIACEDTRVTGKLIAHFEIPKKKMVSIHQHSADKAIDSVIDALKDGLKVAYASDAGTPNVNDPGGKLVERAYEEGIAIEVIPGASAVSAGISACGFPMEHYHYVGFIPQKKHRASTLQRICEDEEASVFFESTHRILKTFEEISKFIDKGRIIYIGRELTKLHETHYRGTIDEVLERLQKQSIKGEFVCIIGPK